MSFGNDKLQLLYQKSSKARNQRDTLAKKVKLHANLISDDLLPVKEDFDHVKRVKKSSVKSIDFMNSSKKRKFFVYTDGQPIKLRKRPL